MSERKFRPHEFSSDPYTSKCMECGMGRSRHNEAIAAFLKPKPDLQATIEALSSKNEEQALVIRELVEALNSVADDIDLEAKYASRSGQMVNLEALASYARQAARAATAKAKQP